MNVPDGIDPEHWTTSSEAARLLGVSPQRVQQMADDDCALEVIRPWPRVTLVERRSLAEWLAGQRPARISRGDCRRFILARRGVNRLGELDDDTLRDEALAFITEVRPCWDQRRRDRWALETASQLIAARNTVHGTLA